MLGDFNVHWDPQDDTDTRCPFEILRSTNLIQHVQRRTHRQGHILDLVITREGDDLVIGVSVSSMLSDHFLINIKFL